MVCLINFNKAGTLRVLISKTSSTENLYVSVNTKSSPFLLICMPEMPLKYHLNRKEATEEKILLTFDLTMIMTLF